MHWVCLLFFLFFTYEAHAQQRIIGPADPSRINKDIHDNKPISTPQVSTGISESNGEKTLNIPANADKIKFVLKTLKISGVESIDKSVISDLYKDKIDQEVSLKEIYEIADSITKIYADKGYILSRAIVPAQEIDKGNVLIKVVEGKIGEVKLEGEVPNRKFLNPALDRMSSSKPMNVYELEKQVLMLNDLAGIKFKSILKPSKIEGYVDLILMAEEVKYQNNIYVNNYGSKYIGPIQGTAKLGLNHSFLLPFNQTDASISQARESNELRYFDISHSIPINTLGTKLTLKASNSKAHPGYTQKRLRINGRTSNYEALLNQTIIRSRVQNLTASFGFNIKDNKTDVLNAAFIREKIRSVKLSATFDRVDDFRGINVFGATYTQGLKTFGASKKGQPNLSRSKGIPDFKKYEASLSRYQALPLQLSALAVINGQYTNNPLLSSEEFGYGGATFGKAYDGSEILGEKGFVGMVELRYDGISDSFQTHIQPFIFYDFGSVWNLDNTLDKHVKASSSGLGFRMEHDIGLYGVFTVAKPLDRKQATPIHSKKKDAPRYGFQIGLKF